MDPGEAGRRPGGMVNAGGTRRSSHASRNRGGGRLTNVPLLVAEEVEAATWTWRQGRRGDDRIQGGGGAWRWGTIGCFRPVAQLVRRRLLGARASSAMALHRETETERDVTGGGRETEEEKRRRWARGTSGGRRLMVELDDGGSSGAAACGDRAGSYERPWPSFCCWTKRGKERSGRREHREGKERGQGPRWSF